MAFALKAASEGFMVRRPWRVASFVACVWGQIGSCVKICFAAKAVLPSLGRRQVVRHWILIPACEGSNPSAPANSSFFSLCSELV